MDLTLLSTDKEQMVLVRVEVEAHTTSKSINESFFLVISKTFALINDELKLDYFFSFELVLHESPVGDTTIT